MELAHTARIAAEGVVVYEEVATNEPGLIETAVENADGNVRTEAADKGMCCASVRVFGCSLSLIPHVCCTP